ncbi:MAG TPA: M14 family zinc carboxypeptidase [Candidatus Limnocylindrales bacterium]
MARRAVSYTLPVSLAFSLVGLMLLTVQPVAAAGEPPGYEYFHTYAENEQIIDNVVAAHPSIAQKFSIGRSYQGRQIWAIKLTQNVDGPTNGKPEVMINGLIHARERAANELALYMLQVLGNNYGRSGTLGKKVTQILNTTVVYVIPMMNPDGAEYDMSGGKWHKWRKNRQPIPGSSAIGIDLNRQFGYTWNCCAGGASTKPSSDYYQGPSAFYAPEDQAYRDFVNSRTVNGKSKITEILSLHSAAKEVLWPYSYTKADVPSDMTQDDHAAFVALGKGIASRNGYKPKQGSDLYIVSGDQDDWAYGTKGIFAITIELPKGAAKRYYPTLSEVNKFNAQNLNAVLWYLKQAGCPYAAAGLGSKHCGNSSNQQYYSQSVFDQDNVQPQQTNCWCAVASTRAMLESIDASTSVAQTDVNDFMTAHDKNDWTNPAFSDYIRCAKGSPSPSYAHDSRGMAWALWNWATPDQSMGFNDYAGGNQGNMDWRIIYSIRANGFPVGATVVHGAHEVLVVGYQTALDPFNENGQANTILGMDVWDPWYNAGFGNWTGWPAGGFAPNSFVTLSDWNNKYFTTDVNEGPYYQGKYIVVMQSSVAQEPSDTPAFSYGDVQYDQANPVPTPSPTDSPAPSDAPSNAAAQTASSVSAVNASVNFSPAAAAATIAQAVADGLTTYGLLGNPDLGNLRADYTLGTAVHVNSLIMGIPSYDLAEVRVNGSVKAIALVDEVNGGYRFGELRATTADVRLPTASQMSSGLAASGLHGTPSLSWTWADDPAAPPPFAPFLTGTDALGRTAYITPAGVEAHLDTVNGVTPATQ